MDKISKTQPLTTTKIIGQKQLTKLKNAPLPTILDLNLTRVYFSNNRDGFSRFLILLINLFWIGLIFLNGIALGKLVATSHLLPSVPAIQMVALEVVTMIITILFAFVILIMILPIFLVKTIKGINLTCVVYLILGTIINSVIITVTFFMFFNSDSPYRLIIMILAIIVMVFWWFVLLNWWLSAKKSRKCLVKSIIKMYDLGYK